MRKSRFKVGDLVVVQDLKFVMGHYYIENGAIGIITEIVSDLYEDMIALPDMFFFDYMVMVNGRELLLFSDEVSPFPPNVFSPCSACECDPCDCSWGHGES